MKLHTIQIHGLKGLNRSFTFKDPSTVFIGENWAGKSAVLQAIQLALFGYVPGLGKTPAATMKLASANEMTVIATFEDEGGRERASSVTLTRRGASCSRKMDPPTLGTSDNMIDLAEWMTTGTAKDRASYVFGKCGLAPSPELFENIRTVLDGVARPAGEAPAEVWAGLKTTFASAKSRAQSGVITMPEFLDELSKSVSTTESDLKADSTRASTMALEIGKAVAMAESVPDSVSIETATFNLTCASGDLAQAKAGDAEYLEAEAELSRLTQELEELDGPGTEHILAELRKEQDAAGIELARRRQVEEERTRLIQRIGKLKVDIALASRDRENAAKAQEEIERVECLLTARRQELKEEQEKDVDQEAEKKLYDHRENLARESRVRDCVRDFIERDLKPEHALCETNLNRLLSEDPRSAVCQCCGQSMPAEKRNEALAKLQERIEAATFALEAVRDSIARKELEVSESDETIERFKALTPELQRKAKERAEINARILELTRAIPYLETQLSRARAARVPTDTGVLERELDELNARLAQLPSTPLAELIEHEMSARNVRIQELERQAARHTALTESATKARERVSRLAGSSVGDERIAELEAALAAADEALKLANRADRIRRANATAGEEHAKASARAEEMTETLRWVREVGKALTMTRTHLIESSIGALLEKANLFLRTILTFRLEYRDGEFGYEKESGWVSLDTISGAERKLTFIGIQFALSAGPEAGIVLLDELGTMTPGVISKVLVRMDELIRDGVISQFIGVLPGDGRDIQGAPCSIITVD